VFKSIPDLNFIFRLCKENHFAAKDVSAQNIQQWPGRFPQRNVCNDIKSRNTKPNGEVWYDVTEFEILTTFYCSKLHKS
jgi:hypothetical protein